MVRLRNAHRPVGAGLTNAGYQVGMWLVLVTLVLLHPGCAKPRSQADTFTPSSVHPEFETASLCILRNKGLRVGVRPSVGGRVVLLTLGDSGNLLDSDLSSWSRDPAQPPTLDTQIPGLKGHTVWLSPQEEWWTRQDLHADKKRGREPWPPDPVLEYGTCRVIERGQSYIIMELPPSPYTGVQLRKTVELVSGSTVRLTVTATNTRREPLTWGLWSNTRVPPSSRAYVPINEPGRVRSEMLTWRPSAERPWPFAVQEGFAFLDPAARPQAGVQSINSKLLVDTNSGLIACFVGDHLLINRSDPRRSTSVHPRHAPIEIFGSRHRHGKGDVLELEMHGSQTTLGPGESVTFAETWTILPHTGSSNPTAQVRFLRSILPGIQAESLP